MEKAASRMKGTLPGRGDGKVPMRRRSWVSAGQELGGEFPIKDVNTGEGGILQVCLEGICLTFENDKVNIVRRSDPRALRSCRVGVYRTAKDSQMHDAERRYLRSRRIR